MAFAPLVAVACFFAADGARAAFGVGSSASLAAAAGGLTAATGGTGGAGGGAISGGGACVGISVGVANARFAKPLDMDLLARIAGSCPRILTLEEHLAAGGFGAGVLEAFHEAGLPTAGLRVHAIPDIFVDHSPQLQQRHNLKLDVEGVVEKALELYPDLGSSSSPAAAAGGKKQKFAETVTW